MTRRVAFITLMAAAALAMAQSAPPVPDSSPETKLFQGVLLDVRRLASAQQYDQALVRLRDAENIKPGSPIVLNARGNIYTNMRAYEKARECYKQAETLNPGSFEPRLNLTELDYVQGNYEAAASSFTKLLAAYPDLQASVRALVQFKIVVCQLKLKKDAEAEELVKRFAFAEESPASYFTRMAFAVHNGDNAGAGALFTKSEKAFGSATIAPYLDAMVEAHWITLKRSGEGKK
jgi:Tfp pilus assembly protein PilF